MAHAVHISTMQKMLNTGDPVSLRVWTARGEIIDLPHCISLRYNFYSGTRNIKLLSGQIRRVRDVCIFSINDMEVFL